MTRRGFGREHLIVFGLVLAGLVFPMEAVALFCLICAAVFVWILIGATYFTLHYFYRGFRYGEWMEA